MDSPTITCPECDSTNIIKNGKRPTENGVKQKYQCRDCQTSFTVQDPEIIEQNIKLKKSEQLHRDLNRIERKSFREFARVDNSLISLNKELIEILKQKSFDIKTIKHPTEKKEDCVLIVQLSDLHLNECIYDVPGNRFDFYVAAKRLKKFADRIKNVAKAQNIKSILIAGTGDVINSDRRISELLNQSTNRSKAMFLSVNLLGQFIVDLNSIANISLSFVTGNESRIREIHEYSDICMTDNYDYSIFQTLKILFKDSKGISFIDGNFSENVIKVGKINILLTHGTNIKSSGIHSTIQQIFGRYSSKGIKLSMVLFGHLHSAAISDFFARSSSLCGSNSYSEYGLNLNGGASQLIHLVYADGSIDSSKICLQNTDNVKNEYKIDDDENAYNPKSQKKLKDHKTVFEIVI